MKTIEMATTLPTTTRFMETQIESITYTDESTNTAETFDMQPMAITKIDGTKLVATTTRC